uniref:Uncharacterized protein n=1 Tax=Cucumis melo TaxID=3656 RepID=A0A9I9E1S7_CUCME
MKPVIASSSITSTIQNRKSLSVIVHGESSLDLVLQISVLKDPSVATHRFLRFSDMGCKEICRPTSHLVATDLT